MTDTLTPSADVTPRQPARWTDRSFIEVQFPVSKLSKESYKERTAVQTQTLTGLGKWWGRKPLVLVGPGVRPSPWQAGGHRRAYGRQAAGGVFAMVGGDDGRAVTQGANLLSLRSRGPAGRRGDQCGPNPRLEHLRPPGRSSPMVTVRNIWSGRPVAT